MALSYTHLGRVAYDAGDYIKTEAMFQKALALTEKGVGPDHFGLTGYLNDLAMVYCTTGSYTKGESLYQRAISINEQKASMGRTSAQESLFGLGRCYAAEGRSAEAVKSESRASELEEHYVALNLAVGSEREKLAFLNSLSSRLSRNISLHTGLAPDDPAARTLAVTSILERKGRIQDAMSASLDALRERSGPEDQKLLDQLNDATGVWRTWFLTDRKGRPRHIRNRPRRWKKNEKISRLKSVSGAPALTGAQSLLHSPRSGQPFLRMLRSLSSPSIISSIRKRLITKKLMASPDMLPIFCAGKVRCNGRNLGRPDRLTRQ